MSKKYTLFTFKGICMNFLLELRFFILSHPLTEKQPPKVVQIHMTHPVEIIKPYVKNELLDWMKWEISKIHSKKSIAGRNVHFRTKSICWVTGQNAQN